MSFFFFFSKSDYNLQLMLLREAPQSLNSSHDTSLSPHHGTNTLPRSHRFRSPTHTHSTSSHTHPYNLAPPSLTGGLTQPAYPHNPLSASVSYGALSQQDQHMSLSTARSSHHYSSLSHLPRTRVSGGGHRYRGSNSSDVLYRPVQLTGFDYTEQVCVCVCVCVSLCVCVCYLLSYF